MDWNAILTLLDVYLKTINAPNFAAIHEDAGMELDDLNKKAQEEVAAKKKKQLEEEKKKKEEADKKAAEDKKKQQEEQPKSVPSQQEQSFKSLKERV